MSSRRVRLLLLSLATALVLSLLWVVIRNRPTAGLGSPGAHDFIEYWGAGRLLLDGRNPYDPAALLAVERGEGWSESLPLLMWNPPFALALVLPLAALPFGLASRLWLGSLSILTVGSGLLLWRYSLPRDHRYWVAVMLCVSFYPTLSALRIGQISPWLLLGVVGFLAAERQRRDGLAGACLSLLLVKPHLAYLFWLAALWWAWRNRRWGLLGGFVAALACAGALVTLFNPQVWCDYLVAFSQPPLYWMTPSIGTLLRLALRPERGWLQYLPSLLGLLGLGLWLRRNGASWRWETVAPPLLLASVCTAAYGWSFDQIVLLPAVVGLLGELRRVRRSLYLAALLCYAAFQLLLVLQSRYGINDLFTLWHPLALAGLYAWGMRKVLPVPRAALAGG